MFYLLVVPSIYLSGVLVDAIRTLNKITQFQLSKLQVSLFFSAQLLFTLAILANAILIQYKSRIKDLDLGTCKFLTDVEMIEKIFGYIILVLTFLGMMTL